MLTNSDIQDLTSFRRALHERPELSGAEVQTAEIISQALNALQPSELYKGLGGHGVAAVFDSGIKGPTILFRAELDALPIQEETGVAWRSKREGAGHLCGHDGHMTTLLGLARLLRRQPVNTGRIVLMFQPAEEDGSGARLVVADPRFDKIAPDYAFAIHNEPGLPFGYVGTRAGLINCASRGLSISLHGKTSHAAEPELACSPIPILGEIVARLEGLSQDGSLDEGFRLVTITHMRSGEPSFGITPGEATIFATLRSGSDEAIAEMQSHAEDNIKALAKQHGLTVTFEIQDDFAASINDPDATIIAQTAMDALSIPYGVEGVPMRASEDFGVFGWGAKSAMLCLGPGETHPALHQPDYDFDDNLIPIGAHLFERIARDLLG